MTIQPRMSYAAMIATLFKKDDFNTAAQDLMHAAIGVAGETVELMFSTSPENVVEEFGDLEFYVEAAVQSLATLINKGGTLGTAMDAHLVREKFDLLVVECSTELEEVSLSDLVYFGGEVLDYSKKLWVYHKPVAQVQDDLLKSLANLKAHMLALYTLTHLTEEGVRHANQDKLVYGPNARFKDAVYTDAAANARADKQGE